MGDICEKCGVKNCTLDKESCFIYLLWKVAESMDVAKINLVAEAEAIVNVHRYETD